MVKEVKISAYKKEFKPQWNNFITNSKNGVFLFYRNYMEYHADRFIDHSLVFFEGTKLVAVMPANVKDNLLYSHAGLTFGGIVSEYGMETQLMLKIFDKLVQYCESIGIKKIIYKAIPYIYHKAPSEEDLYALFRHNAKLTRRDVSSAIFMEKRAPFTKRRRWCVNKSKTAGLIVERSYAFKTFMDIEGDVLRRKYGVTPTHTSEEMQLLAERFPDNIKLFTASKADAVVAGVIIYESENVAHTQYIASTDEGKKLYATDYVLDFLINNFYTKKRYFDFGISTEKEGRCLNEGLIAQKEEFGASAVDYDSYELEIRKE